MNKIDLKGEIAIVTGGAQGIGLATANRLAAWPGRSRATSPYRCRWAGAGVDPLHLASDSGEHRGPVP